MEADLEQEDCWHKALSGGIEEVYHVAAVHPKCDQVPLKDKKTTALAVQGTLNVLKACQASGTVRKVVMTSSAFAIWNKHPKVAGKLSEEDWGADGTEFEDSKIKAEQAAWAFINDCPEKGRFELAVINPGFVVGPLLYASESCGTCFVKALLEKEMPYLPKFHAFVIDVRDLAKAHINAMRSQEASGHRHIAVSSQLWYSSISEIIAKEFNPMGYHIPNKEIPAFVMKIASFLCKSVRDFTNYMGTEIEFDKTRLTNVLDIKPIPIETSISDMCHSLIELGMVKKTPNYQRAEVTLHHSSDKLDDVEGKLKSSSMDAIFAVV